MWGGYGAPQGPAPEPTRRSRSPSRRRSGSRHSERGSYDREDFDRRSDRSSRDRYSDFTLRLLETRTVSHLCRRYFRDETSRRPKGRFSRSSSPTSPPRRRQRTDEDVAAAERHRLSVLAKLERAYGINRPAKTSTPKRPEDTSQSQSSEQARE